MQTRVQAEQGRAGLPGSQRSQHVKTARSHNQCRDHVRTGQLVVSKFIAIVVTWSNVTTA